MVGSVVPARLHQFITRARGLVEASGIKSPPVNPKLIAKAQGIERIVVSYGLDVSGELIRDRGELVIKVNGNEPIERRNFSCCHEIAHTFALDSSLPKSRITAQVFPCSPRSYEEHLCDQAAAEMLLPERMFRPIAANLCPSMDSLIQLSRMFACSISATIIRVGQLAVWPVIFVVWRFAGRPGASRKLRVSWSARPTGYRCYVPRHVPANPASGIFATFLSACPTLETEELRIGSLRGKYLVENGRFGERVVSIVHDPELLGRMANASRLEG